MKFEGTIVITDPCYIIKDKDWNMSYSKDLMPGIWESTIYGDWGCSTFRTTTEEIPHMLNKYMDLCDKLYYSSDTYGDGSQQVGHYTDKLKELTKDDEYIGKFCADSGQVCVFNLDDVLKYNSDFSKFIEEHSWCVTVIPDFKGEVEYFVDDFDKAHIIGKGNTNFYTLQTSY